MQRPRSLNCRPRESGGPVITAPCDDDVMSHSDRGVYWGPGSRCARPRRQRTCVPSQRCANLCLAWAQGSARSLSLPPKRGDGAPRRRMPRIALEAARMAVRASPEIRRALTLMTRAPAPTRRAMRHRSAFALYGGRTRQEPVSTPGRLPGGRSGTWLRATHASAASRPALMTPHESAPRRTERCDIYDDFTIKSTKYFTMSVVESRFV
jgi:hypothetical protein